MRSFAVVVQKFPEIPHRAGHLNRLAIILGARVSEPRRMTVSGTCLSRASFEARRKRKRYCRAFPPQNDSSPPTHRRKLLPASLSRYLTDYPSRRGTPQLVCYERKERDERNAASYPSCRRCRHAPLGLAYH